ncbi:phosphatase PAP2 family protein [Pontibacter vulgaris]|uniref:phosphatase PAP2 family protein n=1 Tax=Pontibacter vulgaris TaxID=2905679 RepID=UPI001FA6B031|nr:phosphatase PAP2 family protein [Pontibacter vulgaris]
MKNILAYNIQELYLWLSRLPVILWLGKRFPRLTAFILNRFNTATFVGLPLTMLLLVFWVNASMLSELTEEIIESRGVVALDLDFTQMLYEARSSQLSLVLYVFSYLGTREAVFVVGALATFILLYHKKYVAILVFWLVMSGVGLSVQYGKKYISRNRPSEVGYYQEHNHSFPSGHATTSMALYGLLTYFLARHYTKQKQRLALIWLAGFIILIVGFSRIYLGVHFLTDVLAGFLLGALWILVGVSLVEMMNYHRNMRQSQ